MVVQTHKEDAIETDDEVVGDEVAQGSSGESGDQLQGGDEQQDDVVFDDDLLDLAEDLGVDSDEYDDPADLMRECIRRTRSTASRSAREPAPDKKDDKPDFEELALEAYKVQLSDETLDPALLKELQALSDAQAKQFTKVLNDLRKQHHEQVKSLTGEVKTLRHRQAAQARAADFRLLDRWIARHPDAQKKLGEGDSDDLEVDSREYQARERLLKRVYRKNDEYLRDGRRPPPPNQLFSKTFGAKGKRSGKAGSNGRQTPTRTARVHGAGSSASGNPKEKLTEEQKIERAGKGIAAWQEKYAPDR